MKFPSQAWADALRSVVNADTEYADAARGWEGDILLRVTGGTAEAPTPGVHLDLTNGRCRGARFLADSRSTESEFVFEGSAESWQRVLARQIDPVQAIMGGTLKVRGNMAKLLRFTRAARQLVHDVGSIPVE
ncbi:MAG: SCP2 sterol-binding domain-containing protein [Thermoplasmata archaeon]